MLLALLDWKSRPVIPKLGGDNRPSPPRRGQFPAAFGIIDKESPVFRCGFHRLHPLCAGQRFGIGISFQRIDQRKGQFSLQKVVATRFSDRFIVIIIRRCYVSRIWKLAPIKLPKVRARCKKSASACIESAASSPQASKSAPVLR